MSRIPAPALLLGLAGLIPFLWGAATCVSLGLNDISLRSLPPSFTAQALLVGYGTVILAFMAGVIWGFAAREGGARMPLLLTLSVLPALWAFVFAPRPAGTALLALIAGFIALLGIDWLCARNRLAPEWWMPLRLLLTGVVVTCLLIGLVSAR